MIRYELLVVCSVVLCFLPRRSHRSRQLRDEEEAEERWMNYAMRREQRRDG